MNFLGTMGGAMNLRGTMGGGMNLRGTMGGGILLSCRPRKRLRKTDHMTVCSTMFSRLALFMGG